MIELNKELLSTILGIEVLDILTERLPNNSMFYRTSDISIIRRYSPYLPSINIYELQHKFEEWAFDVGFAFRIEYLGKKDINIQLININTEEVCYSKDFYNVKTIEYIIVPCQWILDNGIK